MRCGLREQFGDGSPLMALPVNRFLYVIEGELPGHSKDAIAGWVAEGTARWGAHVDIAGERIDAVPKSKPKDRVVLRVITASLGKGVIADQELPSPGKWLYTMRWNRNLKFVPTDHPSMKSGTVDPFRSCTHELGHFWGLHHFAFGPPEEIMEPTISDLIHPQPTEIAMAMKWFGKAKSTPTPTPVPTPVPTPGNDDDEIVIRIKGQLVDISGHRFTRLPQ